MAMLRKVTSTALIIFSFITITECRVFMKLGAQDLTVTHGNNVLLHCRAPEIATLKTLLGKQGNVHLSLTDTTWSRFMFMWNGINKGFSLIPTRRETQCQYLVRFIRTIAGTNSVTVLSEPSAGSPSCTMDTPSSHVHVGETIQLTCTSRGGNPPAELQWYSGNRSLQPISSKKLTMKHLLEPTDNGVVFTCFARSRAIERTRSCSLQPLKIEPTVQVIPVTNLVEVEQSTVFKCKGDGVPSVETYQWYFGDQLITSTTGRIRKLGRELHIDEVFWRDHNIIVRCVVATQNGLKANTTGVIRVVYDLEPTALHAVPNGGNGYIIPPMATQDPSTKQVNSLVVLIGLGVCGLLFGMGTIMAYIVYVKISKKKERKKRLESSPIRRGHIDQHAQTSTRQQSKNSIISISSNGMKNAQCTMQTITKKEEKRAQRVTSCNLERLPSEAYKRNKNLEAINEEANRSYEKIKNPDDVESSYYDFSGEYIKGIDYDDVSLDSLQSHDVRYDEMDESYEALRPKSDFLDDADINDIIEAAMRRASLNRDGQLFYVGSKSWAL